MKLNEFEAFLVKCAGGDKVALEDTNVPIEYNKLVGIGTAVLLTGIYAALSMGYTISWVVRDNQNIVLLISFLWGVAIFNLDRLIVGTTYKKNHIQLKDAYQLLFRLLLTMVISLTISVPLELRLFESELHNAIEEERIIDADSSQEVLDAKAEKEFRQKRHDEEADGKGASRRIGYGTIEENKRKEMNDAEKKYISIRNNIREEKLKNDFSFLSLYTALEKMKKNDKVKGICQSITLLILFFEITPVLIKFTLPRGAYDEKVEFMEINSRINIRKSLDQLISANQVTYKVVRDYSNGIQEVVSDKSFFGYVIKFLKDKTIDILLAILFALILSFMTNNYSYIPTVGAILSFIVNSYILPKNS